MFKISKIPKKEEIKRSTKVRKNVQQILKIYKNLIQKILIHEINHLPFGGDHHACTFVPDSFLNREMTLFHVRGVSL